jgi:cellobiose phosphorylase
MSKPRKKKRPPKRVLALPDLEQSKAAVLNTLTSKSGQRSYDRAITDFVDWYCSEPRLAFNRTVVLRYRIFLEQKQYAVTTINLRLAAIRRVAFEAADSGLLSPELADLDPNIRSLSRNATLSSQFRQKLGITRMLRPRGTARRLLGWSR